MMTYRIVYRTGDTSNFQWHVVMLVYDDEFTAQDAVQECSQHFVIESQALKHAGLPKHYNVCWVNSEWVEKGTTMTYTVIYRTGTADDYKWFSVSGVYHTKTVATKKAEQLNGDNIWAFVVPTDAFLKHDLPTSYMINTKDYITQPNVIHDQDDELGYKLAMVMMTGHAVHDHDGNITHFRECLNNIKKYVCPDMDIAAVARRVTTAINRADASWDAFFNRRVQS